MRGELPQSERHRPLGAYGPVQLLLYAVFRVGGRQQRAHGESRGYQGPAVAWMVPLSLGDRTAASGFATTTDYFARFLYGDRQPLRSPAADATGGTLDGFTRLLGAGSPTRSAISSDSTSSSATAARHSRGGACRQAFHGGRHPRTPGTPVTDVHINLRAMEAIHLDGPGAPMPGVRIAAADARKFDLARSRSPQRCSAEEPRPCCGTAGSQRLPGRSADGVLPGSRSTSCGTSSPASAPCFRNVGDGRVRQPAGCRRRSRRLNERRRELAVLRAVGAAPRHVL
jgi:putative ABC transport system permease protein